MKKIISYDDFTKIDIRIGTIILVNDFPKAKKPAYQIIIDFGTLGTKKTSVQITTLYTKGELLNKQVLAVINFKPKQIANFMSECLILGVLFTKGIVLLQTSNKIENGTSVS